MKEDIAEDLQGIHKAILELKPLFPADKKEAMAKELQRASAHLSSPDFLEQFKADKIFDGHSLQELLELSKETLSWLYHSAYTFYEKGEFEKARSLFRLLSILNPNRSDYFMGLGMCYFIRDKIPQAREHFEIARALDSENPESYYFIARCLFMEGNLKEALKVCQDCKLFSKKSANSSCLEASVFLQNQILTKICK